MQAYDGPIYIADAALYLMAHKPELGIKDPYELTEDQYKAALELLRGAAQAGRPLLARRHGADRRLQERRRRRLGVLAVPGQPAEGREAADRLDHSRGRRDRLGRHHHDACRGRASELRLYVAGAFAQPEAAGRPRRRGSARVPAVPAACKGNALLDRRGLRDQRLDNFDRIKFWRTPVAKCAAQSAGCVPYYRWVSDYIAVIGGR